MMIRALLLLLAFSGSTAVHAETVEYGHKLSCEVVKKYENDENREPSQETWEISFDPPALNGTQMDDAKVAIKVDRGDDNVKLTETSISSWYHWNWRGTSSFSMSLNGLGIALFNSLSISNFNSSSISNKGGPEDIGLLGFYHEWSPHLAGDFIRYDGSCRLVTSQVS